MFFIVCEAAQRLLSTRQFENTCKHFLKIVGKAFFISSVSQLGDIFISYLKRINNTKDTGNLLPGHGGILDRFDGIVFAILLGSIMKVFI